MLGAAQDRATEGALLAHDARFGTHLAESVLTGEKVSIFGGYRALDQSKVVAASPDDRALVDTIRGDSKKAGAEGCRQAADGDGAGLSGPDRLFPQAGAVIAPSSCLTCRAAA